MKRKEVDQVSQDFSHFSLSSPPTKIRRLDAELPPIVEEDEPPHVLPIIEAENQEKALVLFKPINSHSFVSPSTLSFTVDSHIVSGIKNQFPWSSSHSAEARKDNNNNDRLALVPWVPSQFPPSPSTQVSDTEPPQLMEAEEMEEASMDIEQDNNANSSIHPTLHAELTGMHPWHQHHCFLPQFPHNTSTPIPWTR
ncbi:STE20-like serine/threonine-protein kinase [Senna tora]|uniref:STE20-like serine/threonine-protein kinase n=1 Tax=Senna tora TaxID=362788 RepID=A0A834T447_9FABA|nr:STE20-like serine/threonine-protein kinase [Senna tora]